MYQQIRNGRSRILVAAYIFFSSWAVSGYLTYLYLIQKYPAGAVDNVQNAWAGMAWHLVWMDGHVFITTGPEAGVTFQQFLGWLAQHQGAWDMLHHDFITLLWLPPAAALVLTLAIFAVVYQVQQHKGV